MNIAPSPARLVTGALAALMLACPAARSQDSPAEQPTKTYTHVYDVRDMIMHVRDYPYWSEIQPPTWEAETFTGPYYGREDNGTGFFDDGGGGGGGRDDSLRVQHSREALAKEMVELVRAAIDPTSWRAAGGEVGAIRHLHGQLVVTQTAEVHKQILDLLTQLRESIALVLRIRARWVAVGSDQAAGLLGDKTDVPIPVTPQMLKQARARTIYQGVTTGYNGQLVHLAKGRGQNFLTGLIPVVADNASAARPVVEKILWGVVLEARPTLSVDRKGVVLDIRSVVSEPVRPRAGAAAKGAKDAAGAPISLQPITRLDRLDFLVQTLRTTISMPLAKPMLIGGMTAARGAARSASGGADGDVLLLIVDVSVSKPARPPKRAGKAGRKGTPRRARTGKRAKRRKNAGRR